MKLLYIANIRLPTEKAHGVQIMKTCEALHRAGVDVELIATDRYSAITEDPFSYYRVRTPFPIIRLHVLDLVEWGYFGFMIEQFSFAFAASALVRKGGYDIVFSRDEAVLWFCWLFGGVRSFVWETHTGSWNIFARFVAKRAEMIVAITSGLRRYYASHGIPETSIIVAHDAIDLAEFSHPESKQSARQRLGLPQDAVIAMYIGRLDGWKGAETFCQAFAYVPTRVHLVVIGGEPPQVDAMRARYPQVLFLGYRPYREIADNQAAADVLVLPNTARDPVSVSFTSPLKLFTYMASGRIIVASDLPSVREVLDERSAILVQPDDPRAIAAGICAALENSNAGLSRSARRVVEAYTWEARARRIIEAIRLRAAL